MTRYAVPLGPVTAELSTDCAELVTALADFYTLHPHRASAPAVTITARREAPTPDMARTEWGVGYRPDPDGSRLTLATPSVYDLAVTTRKALREPLLAACQTRGGLMLHASALQRGNQVVIIVGESGSGKTTLALDAVVEHGATLLSNDHLLLYPHDSGLILTALPTVLPVKAGTYLDLADALPPPWDHADLPEHTLAAVRTLPPAQRHRCTQRVLYTYRALGQPPVPYQPLTREHRVTVVLADYATPPAAPTSPKELTAAQGRAALAKHLRGDWWADPNAHTHFLPRTPPSQARQYAGEQESLAALVERATVVRWHHRGSLEPLWTWLETR